MLTITCLYHLSLEVPTDKPGVDGQQKLEPKTTAETATLPTLLVSTSQTPQVRVYKDVWFYSVSVLFTYIKLCCIVKW